MFDCMLRKCALNDLELKSRNGSGIDSVRSLSHNLTWPEAHRLGSCLTPPISPNIFSRTRRSTWPS